MKALTPNNLASISFSGFLGALKDIVLEEVPEGTKDDEALLTIDTQLGRFANLHAYLQFLCVVASEEAKRLKMAGATAEWSLMVEKRDALEKFARAIKLKHDACSRMVTVWQELHSTKEAPFDRIDHQGREERRMKGWSAVSDPPKRK